ncbi:hypothetical protein [Anoxybacillus eryuanensis]|uniref:hypothetical protein n=1 Tax=Anoxybacillus eryuanensis TaxID=651866 RepID=UPI003EF54DB5
MNKQEKAQVIEEFLQRLSSMAGTGNGIGKGTVKKIREFAEKEGYVFKERFNDMVGFNFFED